MNAVLTRGYPCIMFKHFFENSISRVPKLFLHSGVQSGVLMANLQCWAHENGFYLIRWSLLLLAHTAGPDWVLHFRLETSLSLTLLWNFNLSPTRWYSSNGPAARLLRWSVFVLCLVTYGHVHTCHKCYMYSYPNSCTILYLKLFPDINFVWKATFAKKIIFWEVLFLRKLNFPGSRIFQEITFSRKTHFPEIYISRELIFPMK